MASRQLFHALRWSVKVFQREVGLNEQARPGTILSVVEGSSAHIEEDVMRAPRLAGCPPPASVMVVTGDPPSGRGQPATSRQMEATHRPGTSYVAVDRNGLPRKFEVPEE
jgi:hypothetical protein